MGDDLPKLSTPAPMPGDCLVKEYILDNITPYDGDASFLAPATERTLKSWKRCEELMAIELEKGIYDVDTKTPSTITSHAPGYVLSAEEDVVVGLQTDEPLKRSCKPRGGFKVVKQALESYGYKADPAMQKTYTVSHENCMSRTFSMYVTRIVICLLVGMFIVADDHN
jgi:formate C-acetyltransferase